MFDGLKKMLGLRGGAVQPGVGNKEAPLMKQPQPPMPLGDGMAANAAKAVKGRKRRLDDAEDEAMGLK